MDSKTSPNLSFPDLEMVFVEGGTFAMGDAQGDLWNACRPVHSVRLNAFYLSKYPVTQALWEAVMGENPSRYKGSRRPVERVSWEDTQGFIEKLNKKTEMKFRLPTEAKWEYAARGGVLSEGYLYSGSDRLRQVGWYGANSGGETHEVGQLRPNELGLYDMSGNVWEWCEDWYSEAFYKECNQQGLVGNPLNLTKGTFRVLRGGCYFFEAEGCRYTYRNYDLPGNRSDVSGFRLVALFQGGG